MKRRHLPLVLLTASALLLAPATAASATGDGDHRWGASTWHGWPGKGDNGKPGKPGKGEAKPSTPRPEWCGGTRKDEVIPWDAYTCAKATGYFLYEKKDRSKPAGYYNSKQQHRVALHTTWAWPTADDRQRHGASKTLPRQYDVIPVQLDAADKAAVCAAPDAYGLQVDLVGDGVAGRGLDVPSLVPTVITPPNDGGFPIKYTLAFYGHYDVAELVDVATLCAPVVPTPPVTPPATPPVTPPATPTPTPTQDVDDEPTPTATPTPTPTADVDDEPTATPTATPAPTTTPAPVTAPTTPAPTPSVTERAEVLSASDDNASGGRGQVLAATGTSVLVGLLAAVAAVAVGAVLMILRRRGRTTEV